MAEERWHRDTRTMKILRRGWLPAIALLLASCATVGDAKRSVQCHARNEVDGEHRVLSSDDPQYTEFLRSWFDPVLQRCFPGWVLTGPLVFSDLFDELHADEPDDWRDDSGEDSMRTKAWQRELRAFQQAFPDEGHGFRLSLDTSGAVPRIDWVRERGHSPAGDLPFETRFEAPQYPEHLVPPGEPLKVDDGWLVCHHEGEFGAWLYWYSNDGKQRYEVAPCAWVNRFFRFGGKLFAIGGLSHLCDDFGTLFELAKAGDHWQAVKTIPLAQEAHLAAAMTDTSFLVLCTTTLVEVQLDGSVRYLYGVINTGLADGSLSRKATWMYYSPNSVVVHEGKVWIGVTFGAVVVALNGWCSNEQWLVPGKEMERIEKHFGLPRRPRIPIAADDQSGQRSASQ